MKEVMLKIISPGKVERARPRAKVPMGVGGSGEDVFELSANTAGGAMRIQMELMCLKAKMSR